MNRRAVSFPLPSQHGLQLFAESIGILLITCCQRRCPATLVIYFPNQRHLPRSKILPGRQPSFELASNIVRSALLYRVTDSGASPRPKSHHFWRQLLSSKEPKLLRSPSNTKAFTLQMLLASILEGCDAEVLDAAKVNGDVPWEGKSFSRLGDPEYEEILW